MLKYGHDEDLIVSESFAARRTGVSIDANSEAQRRRFALVELPDNGSAFVNW